MQQGWSWSIHFFFFRKERFSKGFSVAISSSKEWGVLCSQKYQGEFCWEWDKLESLLLQEVRALSVGLPVLSFYNFEGCVLSLRKRKKLFVPFIAWATPLSLLMTKSSNSIWKMFEAIPLFLAYGCSLYWLSTENISIMFVCWKVHWSEFLTTISGLYVNVHITMPFLTIFSLSFNFPKLLYFNEELLTLIFSISTIFRFGVMTVTDFVCFAILLQLSETVSTFHL